MFINGQKSHCAKCTLIVTWYSNYGVNEFSSILLYTCPNSKMEWVFGMFSMPAILTKTTKQHTINLICSSESIPTLFFVSKVDYRRGSSS